MPHCRPLSIIAPDGAIADPLVVLQGLSSLVGSVWTHSLASLLPPSEADARIMGSLGLALLGCLSVLAWKASDARVFRLLIVGCLLSAGMLFLVALGRNPEYFALPNQMIARRFMPLSIFFWTCLLAAVSCLPHFTSRRFQAFWGAVYAMVGSYIMVVALLTVSWMSSMRVDAEQFHFTAVEMKLEAIRVWVEPESEGNSRIANTLGLLDPVIFWNNVDELRSRRWGLLQGIPIDPVSSEAGRPAA